MFASELFQKSAGRGSKLTWGQSMDKNHLKKTYGCPVGHESTSMQGPPKEKGSTVEKLRKKLGRPKPSQIQPAIETERPKDDEDDNTTNDEPSVVQDQDSIASGKYIHIYITLWYTLVHLGTFRYNL